MILWYHSKVLNAELKVDKRAVVKGEPVLQQRLKTTNH